MSNGIVLPVLLSSGSSNSNPQSSFAAVRHMFLSARCIPRLCLALYDVDILVFGIAYLDKPVFLLRSRSGLVVSSPNSLHSRLQVFHGLDTAQV